MSDKDNSLDVTQAIEQQNSLQRVNILGYPEMTLSETQTYKDLWNENARLREEIEVLHKSLEAVNETCRILNGIISDFHKKYIVEEPVVEEDNTESLDEDMWAERHISASGAKFQYYNKKYTVQSVAQLTPEALDHIVTSRPKFGTYNGVAYRWRERTEPWGAALGATLRE